MASFDRGMRALLEQCDCLDFLKCFTAVTKKSLSDCTIKQLKSKLKKLLPSTDEGKLAMKKIVALLTEAESDSDEEEETFFKTEIKTEIQDNGADDGSHQEMESQSQDATSNNEDDDIIIVKEIAGDVSFVNVVVKQEQHELITLEDETSDGPTPRIVDCSSQKQNMETQANSGRSKRLIPANRKRKLNDTVFILKPVPSCYEKLINCQGHVKLQTSRYTETPLWKFRNWNLMLINYGELIYEMDCHDWTWSAKRKQGRLNLYHILSKTPNLEKLSIRSNCDKVFPGTPSKLLDLPKLKTLYIRHESLHEGIMKYTQALKQIIIASSSLDCLRFEYKDEDLLRIFLTTIKDIEERHLQSLRCLSIKVMEKEAVALVEVELNLLSGIKAPNLEELYLGFSLWEDTGTSFQKMLENFINLKSLTIEGCFITPQKKEPVIILKFPAMVRLECLKMGRSYKFASIMETVEARPAKRRRTTIIRAEPEENSENESHNVLRPSVNYTEEEENHPFGEFFTVTLVLPSLPKLKSIMLGALYDIEDLHFNKFPSLESFRVSSPWHLTVKFPSLARHKVYSKVTQLQLPDCLEDHSFVQKVVTHFPNIEQYWIYLPNVRVLRAFSKALLSSDPIVLEQVDMKVQFDFESSMDWAFLDNPPICIVNGVAQLFSSSDTQKIKHLKSYDHWEEYAKAYHIDIPNTDDLPILENLDEFRGLGPLCEQLKDLVLKIEHIPRNLRLPKGNRNWNDDECEFNDVLIGFESMEYPFSSEAWELASMGTEIKNFKLPPEAIPVHVREPKTFFTVDATITGAGGPSKKDEDVTVASDMALLPCTPAISVREASLPVRVPCTPAVWVRKASLVPVPYVSAIQKK